MSTAAALGDKKRIASREESEDRFPGKYELRRTAQNILKSGFSVMRCQHEINFERQAVDVYSDGKSSWFTGAVHCNSIWTCPVCAAKIAERRSLELQQAIDAAIARGHGAAMVTMTFSHHKTDFLSTMLPAFRKAQRAMKSGRAAEAIRAQFGVLGEVRALEVTWGEVNGWHPHIHAVTFFRRPLSKLELRLYQAKLFKLWRRACIKNALGSPNLEHGVDVRPARSGAEYAAKWGFATELCRLHIKRGKHGRTPWQLLADAAEGDHRARVLFREFAECFKGARQLFWSKGLRARFELGDVLTDQAALALPEIEKKHVATIDRLTWGCVVEADVFELVAAAAVKGPDELEAILEGLRWRYGAAVDKKQRRRDQERLSSWYFSHDHQPEVDPLCLVGARPWPGVAA